MPTSVFYKKFKFVKPFPIGNNQTKVGDELVVMENNIFVNNAMMMPFYRKVFMNLVTEELRNGFNYLKDLTDFEKRKAGVIP